MRYTHTTLILLALSSSISIFAQKECTADIKTVGEHLWQTVDFCGTPTGVIAPESVEGDPVYLNFGGAYPDHTFVVIIEGDVAGKKRDKLMDRYNGKELRIHGMVKVQNGKPSITVGKLKDIVVK